MKNIRLISMLLFAFVSFTACNDDGGSSKPAPAPAPTTKQKTFQFINEQTGDYIAVYGSKTVSDEQYDRAYKDVKYVLDNMNDEIKAGLLKNNAKILVVQNEDELENNIDYFMSLLPLEAIFANDEDGNDETLASSRKVNLSTTKLELMYLSVYYSMLVEDSLADKYAELKAAYDEAAHNGIFTPGDAYVDGYVDEIHQNASDKNALKYGSYLFGLYSINFGNQADNAGEFTISTKADLQAQNPKGYDFINNYF